MREGGLLVLLWGLRVLVCVLRGVVGFAEVGIWNLLGWLLWKNDKAGVRSLEGSEWWVEGFELGWFAGLSWWMFVEWCASRACLLMNISEFDMVESRCRDWVFVCCGAKMCCRFDLGDDSCDGG